MLETADHELLQQYAREGSEAAFAALVARHVNLVYSAALRKTGDIHAAEEVTQAVFIILARKADALRRETILSGWLYQTARLTAINYQRTEIRRGRREQEAYVQSLSNEPESEVWKEIVPLLEDAMGGLSEKDRNAIVLRFFERKNFQEVGATFGASENAAKKRVAHALEKLRRIFLKRGVASTTAILAAAMSAHSVHAAPALLAKSVTAAGIAKGAAASGSTLTLINGALKLMAWTKAKTTVAVAAALLLAGGTTTVVVKQFNQSRASSDVYEKIFTQPDARALPDLETVPPILIVRPSRYVPASSGGGSGVWNTRGKGVYVGATLPDLVAWANSGNPLNVILPDDVPEGSYDYLATLPERQNDALRDELRKQFGLVARRETRTVDVLLLQPNKPAVLNSFRTKGGSFACYQTTTSEAQIFHFTNAPLSLLAAQLVEGYFKKPCLDRTDPKARYDLLIQCESPRDLRGEARLQALRPVLERRLNQLGLELVPSREPVELLVVERLKN